MFPRKSMMVSRTAARDTPSKPGRPNAAASTATAPNATTAHHQHPNHAQGLSSAGHPLMSVAVRIRPLSGKEAAAGHRSVVAAESDHVASIAKLERTGAVLQSEKGQMHAYEFDRVFGQETTNEEVYRETAKKLVPKVLDGINCTIFAYGATGAGKTHSIMGNNSDPGMMPRSMIDLFEAIEDSDDPSAFSVKVSYMEVYCETIRDLLSDSEKPLNPCEHATDGTVKVLGLTERDVHGVDEVLDLVREGSGRRKTEPTAANEFSSRSHAVLQVTVLRVLPHLVSATMNRPLSMPAQGQIRGSAMVTSRRQSHRITIQAPPEPAIRQGRLSLIDLAGSERAAATLNTGTRLREGANINKSLLALANCINALSNGSERVKYRDSKLTHLLKSSLEGDCHVAMLAAVTPSHKSYEESHNTLKYAHRAKNIKSNVVVPAQPPPAAPVIVLPQMLPAAPPISISSTPSKMPSHLERPLAALDENLPSAKKEKLVVVAQHHQHGLFPPFFNGAATTSVPSSTSSSPMASPPIEQSQQQPHYVASVGTMTAGPSGRETISMRQPVMQATEMPKIEQVLKVVQFERDRLQEERDELRVELQKAKETIANLRRSSITLAAAQFQPLPPHHQSTTTQQYYSQQQQQQSSFSVSRGPAPPVPPKMTTGTSSSSSSMAPALPPRRASSRLKKPLAGMVE